MSSGASIAPPERIRSSAVVTTAPAVLTHSTCQRRSDVQVIPKAAPSASKTATAISEEQGKEDEEDGDEEEEEEEEEEDEEDNEDEGDGDDEGEVEDEAEKDEGKEDETEEAKEGGEGEKGGKGSGDENDDGENRRKKLTSSLGALTGSYDLADVETHQRGRSVTPKPIDGDIRMQSPQNTPPKLYGASRTTGGTIRGQATGNFLNAADFSSANKDDYIGPVRGQINLYISNDDPAQLSPDSMIPYARVPYDYAPKTPIASVLKKVARRYSPVQSKYCFFV